MKKKVNMYGSEYRNRADGRHDKTGDEGANSRFRSARFARITRTGRLDGSRTLEEVGQQFNVTRERIRQIEAKALRKLRHPNRSNKVRDYLD